MPSRVATAPVAVRTFSPSPVAARPSPKPAASAPDAFTTRVPGAPRPRPSAEELAFAREWVKTCTKDLAAAKAELKQALDRQAHPPAIQAAGELAALEAQLQPAQDLLAFRLGATRATVMTADRATLADAAKRSGVPEVVRAGAHLRRAPDAEVRSAKREVQRLMLGLDVDTLAKAEHAFSASRPQESLQSALDVVKQLRGDLDRVRADVERAKADQPRRLAGAVQVARDHLFLATQSLADAKAALERLTSQAA